MNVPSPDKLFSYLPETQAGGVIRRMGNRLQFFLKFAVIALCLYLVFNGHYPPAHAQTRRVDNVPVMTVTDAQQDDHIAETNKHLENTDRLVQRQWEAANKNALDISSLQGEERLIGGFLSLLMGGSLVIQVRSKKGE